MTLLERLRAWLDRLPQSTSTFTTEFAADSMREPIQPVASALAHLRRAGKLESVRFPHQSGGYWAEWWVK